MPLKKNDIRTTRKVNPKNANQEPVQQSSDERDALSGRILRSTNRSLVQKKSLKPRPSSPIKKSKSNSKNVKSRATHQVDYQDVPAEHSVSYPTPLTDGKRRRSTAENYITKRFLYDVVEAPKRSRHKKSQPRDTSTASLVAVSSVNLLKRMKSKRYRETLSFDRDLLVNVRSKRGRRLKPRMEYSPSHSISEDAPSLQEFGEDVSTHRLHKRYKRTQKRPRRPHDVSSCWPLPDIFPVEGESPLADEHQHNESRVPHHSPVYSDLLFNELTGKSTHTSRLMDELGMSAHFRTEPHGRQDFVSRPATTRRIGSPLLVQSVVNSAQRRPPFLGDTSPIDESNSIDLINLCGIPPVDRFRTHSGSLDEIEVPKTVSENDYVVDTHASPERQIQLSNDDVEEEDLLAPELSILAGAMPTPTADGGSEASVQLLLSAGGSRRKSPVRPMQVLRTKTSAHTTVVDTDSSPVSVFTPKSDNNSFLMNTSAIVSSGRLSTELDQNLDAHLSRVGQSSLVVDQPQLLPEILTDDSVVNQVMKPPTVLRLTNLSNCDANPVRTQLLSPSSSLVSNSSNSDGSSNANVLASSTGLLPSILTQPPRPVSSILQRVFVNTNINRSTTPSNRSMVSIPHQSFNSSSNVRRRPTILKRSVIMDSCVNPPSLTGQRQTDSDINVSSSRASVLKPGDSTTSQKQAGVVHFSNVAAPSMPVSTDISRSSVERVSVAVSSNTTVNSSAAVSVVSPGPTKLLQLVTASSLNPVSDSPTNLTASDKLFGRRTVNYNKTPFVNSPGSTGLLSSVNVNYGDFATVTNAPGIVGGNMPYRYAVVRGSADGKRYLVLGSHGGSNTSVLNTSTTGITASVSHPTSTDSDIHESQVLPLEPCQSGVVDPDESPNFEIISQDPNPSANDMVPTLVHRLTVAPVLTST